MTMWAWRDLGHGWVVGNQSVVCGLTACVPLLQLPLSALSLFVFWQRIIGGSMQIAYCGLKWYGKACAVQCYIHIRTLFSCSQACVWFCLCVNVFYLYVVSGVAPVSLGVQVTQAEAFLLAEVNLCHRSADLTCHEVFTWNRYVGLSYADAVGSIQICENRQP